MTSTQITDNDFNKFVDKINEIQISLNNGDLFYFIKEKIRIYGLNKKAMRKSCDEFEDFLNEKILKKNKMIIIYRKLNGNNKEIDCLTKKELDILNENIGSAGKYKIINNSDTESNKSDLEDILDCDEDDFESFFKNETDTDITSKITFNETNNKSSTPKITFNKNDAVETDQKIIFKKKLQNEISNDDKEEINDVWSDDNASNFREYKNERAINNRKYKKGKDFFKYVDDGSLVRRDNFVTRFVPQNVAFERKTNNVRGIV